MPVPSSSIKLSDIATEIGGQSAPHTLSTLAGLSSGTFSGGGNATAPHAMSEWANYTHTISMGSITYNVRLSTATATWGLNQAASDNDSGGAYAEGAITLWRTHDGTNTYIKAKAYNSPTAGDTHQYHNGSSAQNLTLSTTGVTLITIPVNDVTITATVTGLTNSSISYTPTSPAGSGTPDDISGTGASLLVCRGAEQSEADEGDADYQNCKFKVTFVASKSGYQTTNLDGGTSNAGIIVHSANDAEATGGGL